MPHYTFPPSDDPPEDPEEETPVDALVDILKHYFGLECWDDSVTRTAERVLDYWQEFSGKEELSIPFPLTVFPAPANNLVAVTSIEFASLCAHHLLPFYGVAHVGYLPNKLAVGLSKIPRLVDWWAARPQMQERLTEQIADDLKNRLQAHGVAVVLEARHTCMACRGVRKYNGTMITSTMKGIFLTSQSAKQEFLDLIRTGHS